MTKFVFVSSLVFLNALLISTVGLAASDDTSSKCPGETGYYFTNDKQRNPRVGGFVSNEATVDDDDAVTIEREAAVCGSSSVSGRVTIFGRAVIKNSRLEGSEKILVGGSAKISDGVHVTGKAEITEEAILRGNILVDGSGKGVRIFGNADLFNSSSVTEMRILEQAHVFGNAELYGSVTVQGIARVFGKSRLSGSAIVKGNSQIQGFTKRSSGTLEDVNLDDPDYEAIAAAKAKEAKAAQDRLDAQAAEAASIAASKSAYAQKIQTYRGEIEAVYNKLPTSKLHFTGDCHFVIKSDDSEVPFDLTRNSTAPARKRTPPASGFNVYPRGEEWFEVRLESEMRPTAENPGGAWTYRMFQTGEKTARAFVEKLEFLWNACR